MFSRQELFLESGPPWAWAKPALDHSRPECPVLQLAMVFLKGVWTSLCFRSFSVTGGGRRGLSWSLREGLPALCPGIMCLMTPHFQPLHVASPEVWVRRGRKIVSSGSLTQVTLGGGLGHCGAPKGWSPRQQCRCLHSFIQDFSVSDS